MAGKERIMNERITLELPGVTKSDLCYEAGLSDAAREITTGESVYTGPDGMLTMDEAYAYLDGRTWALNNRELVTL